MTDNNDDDDDDNKEFKERRFWATHFNRKWGLLTFFSLKKTIYPRVLTKALPNDAKSPLSVDVRRSKTLLLKLPKNEHRHQMKMYNSSLWP